MSEIVIQGVNNLNVNDTQATTENDRKSSSYLSGGLTGDIFGENEHMQNNVDTDQDAESINQDENSVKK